MANSLKVSRVQKRGQVTIPIEIRQQLGLEEGDLVAFVETPQGVLLSPQTVVPTQPLNRGDSSPSEAQPTTGAGPSDLFAFVDKLVNGSLRETQPTINVKDAKRIVKQTAGIFAHPNREAIDFEVARQEFLEETARRIKTNMSQEDE